MRHLLSIFVGVVLTGTGYAQGLVKFANSASTLISINGSVMPPAGPGNPTFYFALLSAPLGTIDYHQFVFAGIYATNTTATTGGRIQGGSLLGVVTDTSWNRDTTNAFYVAGWSADNGAVFNPAWIGPGSLVIPGAGSFRGTEHGYFGVSMIANGYAGLWLGPGPPPISYYALPIFSGTTISQGFVLIPEPAPMHLLVVLLASRFLFLRRTSARKGPSWSDLR